MLSKKVARAQFGKAEPYKKVEFPRLSDYALTVVAANFQLYPALTDVPPQVKDKIISKARLDLPVSITTSNIHSEAYWKAACERRWKELNDINLHGNSWKVNYLEKHIEELIQTLKNPEEIYKVMEDIKACKQYVYNLVIKGLLVPVDFKNILNHLSVLSNLSVTYGSLHAGMEYKRQSFGMKLRDAEGLAEGLKNANNLLYLSLPGNLIDDDLMRILMAGVGMNRSLIHLNLSHNRVGNQGARRIAKFILKNEILLSLDLSDNQIGYDGSRFLAQAIKGNKTLEELNLKLNQLRDKAGAKFFKDLEENKTLKVLHIAANSLGLNTAPKIANFLTEVDCSLKRLDISSNDFDNDSFDILKNALVKNDSLEFIDVRCNKLKPEYENALREIVVKQHLNSAKIPFISQQDRDDKWKKINEIKMKHLEEEKARRSNKTSTSNVVPGKIEE